MRSFVNMLEKRIQFLRTIIANTAYATDNNISIKIKSKGLNYYYYLKDGYCHKRRRWIYQHKDTLDAVRKAAQEQYDRKVNMLAERELKLAMELLELFQNGEGVEQYYFSMPAGRQLIVEPIVQSDFEYKEKWLAQKYEGQKFFAQDTQITTQSGIVVRSKSEVLIADLLDTLGVPYRYEYPLCLRNGRNIYPDFTLLDVKHRREIRLEHFGMVSDSGYYQSMLRKLRTYASEGYFPGDNLIVSLESADHPIDIHYLKAQITHCLERE